jgi:chorismate dehydratase
MLHSIRVRVQGKYLNALTQQMNEVAPISASGIQHAHSRPNISPKNLIEDVNINASKLLLNAQRHKLTITEPAILKTRCPPGRRTAIATLGLVALADTPLLRIAAIDYLNPAPLMWDFEHAPRQAELAHRYSIHRTTPSKCARELADGTADIGLIPAAAYAHHSELAIIPGCAIASLDHVRSILLVIRADGGVHSVQTVAADTSSRTSLAYIEILFRKYWKPGSPVEFLQHPPDLDLMLAHADAALLIGDPALLALEDASARVARTGEHLQYLDLAHEWHQLTGLAWVSAFWAVRLRALDTLSAANLIEDFEHSRDAGLAHIDDLVAEWTTRIAIPAATIKTYLTRNIHYHLDEVCLAGLRGFYRAAEQCGVLPAAPDLRML